MNADTFEEIEATPLGWATIDQVFTFLQHRRYGEPVILIRPNADTLVLEECNAQMLRKVGRSLIRLANDIMEEGGE